MRLYNTLTRTEETFAPSHGNTVRMYTCGLTVYARGHIGNFRTFVCIDVLRRTLKYLQGHEMRQVLNFTDVDDRTIAGAQKAGMDLRDTPTSSSPRSCEDARALGLEEVEESPRATDEANLRGDGGSRQRAHPERPHLRQRRVDLFQDLDDARLWPAGAARSRRHEGRRAGRCGSTTRKTTRATSCCGRRAKPGEPTLGSSSIRRDARDGIWNARRWRCACLASRRSTSTPAAST